MNPAGTISSREPRVRACGGTLWLGLAIILACEILLFGDVIHSGRGALDTGQQIARVIADQPQTALWRLARWVAINMTPLAWLGYVLFLDGVLTLQRGGSPVRSRPHHFAMLCLASIIIWCIFDWVNFYFIDAWSYIGVPPKVPSRVWAYFLAFATIVPGMLMTGQVLLNMGLFDWARHRSWRMPRWSKWVMLLLGVVMFAWPLLHRDPVTNYTLWVSLIFLLDPINQKLRRPSALRDWQSGWYGRALAACAGGFICGLLWEFWNYWALAKWVYHLPFLGAAENLRYFQMPVLGLLGFIPFGLECWVMWQTMRIRLDGLVEPLPDDRRLL